MTNSNTTVEPHWNYFLALDSDLPRLSRFVEFEPRNFDCFSLEIARILLASAAECEVVAKQLCEAMQPGCGADKLNPDREIIVRHLPQLPAFEVAMPRHDFSLHPWDEWNRRNGVLAWWTANNKVKHHRHTHFNELSTARREPDG